MARGDDKIEIENVNHPGKTHRVDRAKYEATRKALLDALPPAEPGLTQAEMIAAVRQRLPQDLFPGGEKAGWWTKGAQLDLEAKGLIVRHGKPNRWRRV